MQKNIKHFKFKLDMSLMALFLVLASVCLVFVGSFFDVKKYVYAFGVNIEVSTSSALVNAINNANYGDTIILTEAEYDINQNLYIDTSLTIYAPSTRVVNLNEYNITITQSVDVAFRNIIIQSTYSNGVDGGVVTLEETASLTINNSTIIASNYNIDSEEQSTYNAIYCQESAMLNLISSDVTGNIDITNSATLSAERLIGVQGVIKATASSLPIITNFDYPDRSLPLYFENKQDLEEVYSNSGYVLYNGNASCQVYLYKDLQKSEQYINYAVSSTGTTPGKLTSTKYMELDLNATAGTATSSHYFWIADEDGVTKQSQDDIYKEYPYSTLNPYKYAYKNIYDYSSYTEMSSATVNGNKVASVSNDGWVTFKNIFYDEDTVVTKEGYYRSHYPTFFTKSRPEAVTAGKSYVAVLEVAQLDIEGTIYLNINSQNDSTFDSQFEPNTSIILEKTGVYYVGLIGASFQNADAANYFLRSHLNVSSGAHITQMKLRLKVLEVGVERNSSEQLTDGLTASEINSINKTYLQRVLGTVVNTDETAKVTNSNIMVAYYRDHEYCNAKGDRVFPYIANGDYLPTVFKVGDSLKGWATTAQNGTVIDYSAMRSAKTLYAQYNSSASIKLLINHDEKFSVLNEGGNNKGALYLENSESYRILTQVQTGVQQVTIDKDTGVITIYKNTDPGYFGEGVEDLYITITNPTNNTVIRQGKASENSTKSNITFERTPDNVNDDYFTITFDTGYLATLTYMPIVKVDIIWQKRIVEVNLNSDINDKPFDTNEVASFNGIDVGSDTNSDGNLDSWIHQYEVEYGNSIDTTKQNWFNPKLNTDGNSRPSNQLGSTILLNEDGWLEYNDENSSAYPRVFTDYNEEFADYVFENNAYPTGADIFFTLFIEVRDFEYIIREYDSDGNYIGNGSNISSIVFAATNNFPEGKALNYDGQKYNIYSQFESNSVTITGDGVYKVKLKFNGTTFTRRKKGETPKDDSIDQYYFLRSDFNNAITVSNGNGGSKTVAKGNLSCKLRFKLIEGYSVGDSYIYTKYGESNLVAERSKYIAQDYIVYDATGTKIMEKQGENSQIDAPDENGAVSKIDIWSFPTINKITTNLTVKVKWYGAVAYYGVSSTLDGAQESFANFQEALNKAVQYGGYLEIYSSVKYDVESSLYGELSATYTGSNAEQVVNIYTKNTKDVNLTLGSSGNISFNNIKFVINGLGSGYKNVNITTSNKTLFNLSSSSKLVLNSGEFTASDEVVHHFGDELTIKGDATLNGSVGLYSTQSLHSLPTKLYLGGSPTLDGINLYCSLAQTRENPTTDSNDAQIQLVSDYAPKGNFSIDIDENQFTPEENISYLLINTQRHKITMGDINNIISADDKGKGCSLGKVKYDGTVYLTLTKNLKYSFNLNENDSLTYTDDSKTKEVLPSEATTSTTLTPSQNAKLTQGYVKQQNVQLMDFDGGYQRIYYTPVINTALATVGGFDGSLKFGAYFESTSSIIDKITGIAFNNVVFYGTTGNTYNPSILTAGHGSAAANSTFYMYSGVGNPHTSTGDVKGEIVCGYNSTNATYYMYIFVTPLTSWCFNDERNYPNSYYDGKVFIDIWGTFDFYDRNGANSRYFNDCKDSADTLIKYAGQMFYENNGAGLTNTYIAPNDSSWHAAIQDISSTDFYAITSFADISANGEYYYIKDLPTALSGANGKSLYVLKSGLIAPGLTGNKYNFTLDTEIISAGIDESFMAYTNLAVTGGKQIDFNSNTLSANSGKTITISYLNTTNLTINGSQNLTITSGSFNGNITCNNLAIVNSDIQSSTDITVGGNLTATSTTTNSISFSSKKMIVTDGATIKNYNIVGSIEVNGVVDMSRDTSFAYRLTGALTVKGTGASSISNYTITGATTIAGSVVIDNSTFNSTLVINAAATISSSILKGKLTLTSGTSSITSSSITNIDVDQNTKLTLGGIITAANGTTIKLKTPSITKNGVQLTFDSSYAKGGSYNINIEYQNATQVVHYLLLNSSGKTGFYSITHISGYSTFTNGNYVGIHRLTTVTITLNVYGSASFTVKLNGSKAFYISIGGSGLTTTDLAIGTNTIYLDSATTLAYRVTAGGSAARYATSTTSEIIQINTVDESITLSSNKATITIYDVISVTYTMGDADGGTLPENNPYYYIYSNLYILLDPNLTKLKKKQIGWSIQGTNGRLFATEYASVNRILEPVFEDVIIWASNSADGIGGVYYDTLQEAASSNYTYIEIVSSILDTSYVGSNFNRSGQTVYIFASNTNVELKNQGITFTAGTFYFGDNDETRTANKGFKLNYCKLVNRATLTCIGITGALVVDNYSNIVVDNSVLNTFKNYSGAITLKGTITAASGASITFENPSQTKESVQLIIDSTYTKGGSFNFKIKYTNASSAVHYLLLNNSTAHTSYTGFCSIELITNDGYSTFTNGKYVGMHRLTTATITLNVYGNSTFTVNLKANKNFYTEIGGTGIASLNLDVGTNTIYLDGATTFTYKVTAGGTNGKYAKSTTSTITNVNTVNESITLSSNAATITLYDVLKVTYTKGNDAENNPTLPNDGYVIYNNSYTVSDVYPLTRFKYKQTGWALSDAASTKVTTINNVETNKTLVPFWKVAKIWASNEINGDGEAFDVFQQIADDTKYTYFEILDSENSDYESENESVVFNRLGTIYIFASNKNLNYKVFRFVSGTYYFGDFDDGNNETVFRIDFYQSIFINEGATLYLTNININYNDIGGGMAAVYHNDTSQNAKTCISKCHISNSWLDSDLIYAGNGEIVIENSYINTRGYGNDNLIYISEGAKVVLNNSEVGIDYYYTFNFYSPIINKGTLEIGDGVNIYNTFSISLLQTNYEGKYHINYTTDASDKTKELLVSGDYYGSYGILNMGTLNMSGGKISHTGDSPVWTSTEQNGITTGNFYKYHAFVAGVLNTDSGVLNITGGSIEVTGGTTTGLGYSYGIYNKSTATNNKINGATVYGACGVFNAGTTGSMTSFITAGDTANTFIYSVLNSSNNVDVSKAPPYSWGLGSAIHLRGMDSTQFVGGQYLYAGYINTTTKSSTSQFGISTFYRSKITLNGGNVYGTKYGISLVDTRDAGEYGKISNAKIHGGIYAIYMASYHWFSDTVQFENTIDLINCTITTDARSADFATLSGVVNGIDTVILIDTPKDERITKNNTVSVKENTVIGATDAQGNALNEYGIYAYGLYANSRSIINLNNPTIKAKTAEIYLNNITKTEAFINLKENVTNRVRILTDANCYKLNTIVLKLDGADSIANISVIEPSGIADGEELMLVLSGEYGVLGYGNASVTIKWSYNINCDNDVMAFITLIADNGRTYSYSLNRSQEVKELTLTSLRNCVYTVVLLSPTNHTASGMSTSIDASADEFKQTYNLSVTKMADVGGFYSAENSAQAEYDISYNSNVLAEDKIIITDKAIITVSSIKEKAGNKVYVDINNFIGTTISSFEVTDSDGNSIEHYTTEYSNSSFYFIMPESSVNIVCDIIGTGSRLIEIEADSSLSSYQQGLIVAPEAAREADNIEIRINDANINKVIITYIYLGKNHTVEISQLISFGSYIIVNFKMPSCDASTSVIISYTTQ